MNIYLLTHQRELERKTNTGQLITQVLGKHCKVFVWQRTCPDNELLQRLEHEKVALVYPCAGTQTLDVETSFESLIIIDATWQEAQKMYNHSPYLHGLIKVQLHPSQPSTYTLRRNQRSLGLCTAECAVEILKYWGEPVYAKAIETKLAQFILNAKQ